jgi:hypothetical protein
MECDWGKYPPDFTDPQALKRAYGSIRVCLMDTIKKSKEELERQKQVV